MKNTELYKDLLSEVLTPAHFHAATAEAFGTADRNLRKAFSTGDSAKILEALKEMYIIGRAYLEALNQQSLSRDYTAALFTLIINADMTGVNPAEISEHLLFLHTKFMVQCGRLMEFYSDDDFAKPHIQAITYMECAIFVHMADAYLEGLTDPLLRLTCEGLAEAARDRLSTTAPQGCIPVTPFNLKNLLIDIFSRLNTLGFF